MNLFNMMRHSLGSYPGVATLQSTSQALGEALGDVRFQATLVIGFVSPHLDINHIADTVRNRFPNAAISLCTTATDAGTAHQSGGNHAA
jgi:hypothetical protein